jgi:hypothetical protein
MMLPSLCNGCRCKYRQEKWNEFIPGLGDTAATIFNPIQSFICTNEDGVSPMGNMLKPDMKSLVWLAIGAVVVPFVLAKFNK